MTLDDFARLLNTTDATTVLIDGRSGSGKSTLADHLQRRWASSAVVRLDHIYPGWGGLAWTVDHIRTALLQPRAAGRTGRWQRWNWARAAPDGWRTVEANQRLILEGVGALTTANRALADLGIWIDTPMSCADSGHCNATATPTGRTGTAGRRRKTTSSPSTPRARPPTTSRPRRPTVSPGPSGKPSTISTRYSRVAPPELA